ncbi:threonine transporter RhtB [Prauserella sp. PE36]|uniref:LysE family translocator n=1 Tax=Prauserella endophytica TaxID=1592324 RepID=A0ABY2S2S4_9PSEU|nr:MULTISPECIES: LysE family transporter [Prauserella]RBM11536.1 threonine transporter RhtB [Prauserella sp. PE36]TKG69736.1 LysE family translocator [Prauserella endophytica]
MRDMLGDAAGAGPYLSLVATALVVMGSPGPATVGATATATAFGLRRSMPYLLGSIAGTTAALVVVAAGVASVLLTQPRLGPALLGLSVAYLAWLAYKIATAPPPAATGPPTRAPPTWLHGLVLGVANPKAYAALGTLFTTHRLGLPTPVLETVVKTLVLTALIVFIHLCWAVAGASLGTALRRPRVSRVVNVALAIALLASTAPLVAELLS